MFSDVSGLKAVGGVPKTLQRNYIDFLQDSGIVDEKVCNKIFTYAYHVVSGGYGSFGYTLELDTLMWDHVEDENFVWFSIELSDEYKKSVRKDLRYVVDKISTLINGSDTVLHRVLKGFNDYSAEFDNNDSYAYSQLRKGFVYFCIKTSFDLEFND